MGCGADTGQVVSKSNKKAFEKGALVKMRCTKKKVLHGGEKKAPKKNVAFPGKFSLMDFSCADYIDYVKEYIMYVNFSHGNLHSLYKQIP
jgi:hypothetical protein